MIDSIDQGTQASKREQQRIVSSSQDEWNDVPHKVLTRAEAQALRIKQPMISPWRVVRAQAVVGAMCVVVAWGLMRHGDVQQNAACSALYGAAAVVIPSALLARGMTRRADSPTAAAMGLMFWETIKIAAAVAMLVIAAKVVPQLSWPALLVTMVVCSQMNWFALLWRGR